MNDFLTRTIDPNLPLDDASSLLMMASSVAYARTPAWPRVARSVSRFARPFRRGEQTVGLVPTAPRVDMGATRFFRARTDIASKFTAGAVAPARTPRRAAMATSMLMASSRVTPKARPVVGALDMLRARAIALTMVGTLRRRFMQNALDMQDGKADQNRLIAARGRRYQTNLALVYN